jgi:hypothetical protein
LEADEAPDAFGSNNGPKSDGEEQGAPPRNRRKSIFTLGTTVPTSPPPTGMASSPSLGVGSPTRPITQGIDGPKKRPGPDAAAEAPQVPILAPVLFNSHDCARVAKELIECTWQPDTTKSKRTLKMIIRQGANERAPAMRRADTAPADFAAASAVPCFYFFFSFLVCFF